MWSPNVEFPGSQPLEGLYPGTDYVDVVGIDGYNWGSSQGSQQTWQRPDEIFDATMATVRRLAPGTPIVLAEVASAELGGDKAVWNAQLFDWMAAQPDLAGFVWFQLDKETDWRIDSSRSSTAAFHEGLARLRQAGR
jgi:beta-mannanase